VDRNLIVRFLGLFRVLHQSWGDRLSTRAGWQKPKRYLSLYPRHSIATGWVRFPGLFVSTHQSSIGSPITREMSTLRYQGSFIFISREKKVILVSTSSHGYRSMKFI